jgi:hypothetical protein
MTSTNNTFYGKSEMFRIIQYSTDRSATMCACFNCKDIIVGTYAVVMVN